jgi:UDP-N-acetylmuramyl tripeptide synthase
MVTAAGRTPGFSSTDGVVVGGEFVERGDYSGPEGARHVLRNPRTEIAILETARGGLLRRGLAVEGADVAVVTNIAEDHLGDWGLSDLDTLTNIKLVVAKAVDPDGGLVLNAEDPILADAAKSLGQSPRWFALDADADARLDGGTLVLHGEPVIPAGEIPIAMGGAARHNIANSLAALLVGSRLGLDRESMAEGLRSFSTGPEENPGRMNLFDLGGVRAMVDYAHNPHGYRALFATAKAMPAERRLVVLGQAGDRPDEAIRELVRIANDAGLDRVIVKEMADLLRGRETGEVPAIVEAELRRLGMPKENVSRAPSEIDAARDALRWARPGDLLFLLTHQDRPAVLDLLGRLVRDGWRPGDELPPSEG